MAKVSMKKGDGEKGDNSSANPPKASTTQGVLSNRLMTGFNKEELSVDDCPESHLPMVCGKNTRVGTLRGRVYLFPAEGVTFVHKDDEHDCAKHGARVLDAKAIAAIEKAKIDAAELEEYRAKAAKEKAESVEADKKLAEAKAKVKK